MHIPNSDEIITRVPDLSNLIPIARGGQKVVFRGQHNSYGEVVVKIILSADERTQREIDIATKCDFPNVPKLYKWGVFQDTPEPVVFLIEQFVSGDTLRSHLRRNRTLNLQDGLRLFQQLLDTAVEVEKQDLVHRDIKPENIIVGDDGTFWLLDFGIARHLSDTSITATNAPFGPATLGYAAPEQLRNMKKHIDIRADLFSIGVVMYEVFTGTQPFLAGARDQLDVLRRTENLTPTVPVIQGDSQRQLSRLILVLMDKFASRRPSTAEMARNWYNDVLKTLA